MPFVEIKVFEDELSEAQAQELIQEVTDVMVSFAGEPLREATGLRPSIRKHRTYAVETSMALCKGILPRANRSA